MKTYYIMATRRTKKHKMCKNGKWHKFATIHKPEELFSLALTCSNGNYMYKVCSGNFTDLLNFQPEEVLEAVDFINSLYISEVQANDK